MGSSAVFFDNRYKFINFDEASNLLDYNHAAHCCIYSLNSFPTIKSYESKAYISMQMRFDGRLGFPGGIVEKENGVDAFVVEGLNRELVEEINLDKKYFVTENNHCFTHVHEKTKWCFHFFAEEVPLDDFHEIERNAVKAEDFGKEVLGVIRVPLFIMEDKKGGLPAFLLNNFAGCAKDQLLKFLMHTKLMSPDDITRCLSVTTTAN